MATYLILNLCFIVGVITLLRLRPSRPSKAWALALISLLILTAIFDNIMIHYQLFTYADDMILGLHLGRAPVEDFFYAILAAIAIPALWQRFETKHDR